MRYEQPVPYGWYNVAYSDELATGEVRPMHFFGEELVLFRSDAGRAVAMEPYCPHLGAHLGHGGRVDGESVVCPFHGWRFDGDGICVEVPYASRIPPKIDGKPAIYSYPVIERNQAIWVWYHPRRVAPLFELDTLEQFHSDEWTTPERHEWTINTIIQEAGENAVDTAHFKYVHRNQEVPQGEVTISGHERTTEMTSMVPAVDENGVRDTTGRHFTEGHLISKNCGPGLAWQRFSGIFETVMMASITPVDSQTMRMRFAFTQSKSQSEEQKMLAEAVIANVVSEVQQDIPIWEHKAFRGQPVLCDGDGPIARYRKWFSQFYDAGAAG